MRLFLTLLVLQAVTSSATVFVGEHRVQIDDLPEVMSFERFISVFRSGDLAYGAEAEEAKRRAIFMANLNSIIAHNEAADAGVHTHRQGVNQFTDMTADEFKKTISSTWSESASRKAGTNMMPQFAGAAPPPASVDWRTKGAVTPVKNQGTCGSCWAFSTTGSMEGAFQIATGELRSFSEQQLVDCSSGSSGYGNKGCAGGNFDSAFTYIRNNTGIDSESDYPYQGMELGCWKAAAQRKVASIESFLNVPANTEEAMITAIANGPVSIAIEADKSIFQSYKSGVITNATACGTNLDHGVLAVGYTNDYFIVKNSWAVTWGDKGYVKLGRGNGANGTCGILMDGAVPTIPKGKAPPLPPVTPGKEPTGLPCKCTASCEHTCQAFGMVCCGNGVDCDCSPLSSCPKCKPPSLLTTPLLKYVHEEQYV